MKRSKPPKAAWKRELRGEPEPAFLSISHQRANLKNALMGERGELTAGGWLPICPICCEPVSGPDMHEAIITRGDVQGYGEEIRSLIHVRENCVLVHSGKCHIEAAMEEGKRKCILQLLEKEGLNVLYWLLKFDKITGGLLNDRLRIVTAVYTERVPEFSTEGLSQAC